MNICSHKHDEVVFDGHKCPMCELGKEHDSTLADRDKLIDELRDEVRDLKQEINDNLEPLILHLKAAQKANEDTVSQTHEPSL